MVWGETMGLLASCLGMNRFSPRLSLLICALLASATLLAPAAHADQAIAVSPGPDERRHVGRLHDVVAVSDRRPAAGRCAAHRRRQDLQGPRCERQGPFQVSLGPGLRGNAVALVHALPQGGERLDAADRV